MTATIRKLHLNDMEGVEELYQEYMKAHVSRQASILRSMDSEESEILVAEIEGKIVGLVHQVFYIDPIHAGECSNILFLYVAKPFRKQGVGKSLLRKTLESAAERGVLEVHISARAENTAAINLYKRLGFQDTGPLMEFNPTIRQT